jgi:hypothetical protein
VLPRRHSRVGNRSGGVAQLGERVNGIHEVRGSIPLASMAPSSIIYDPESRVVAPRRAGH